MSGVNQNTPTSKDEIPKKRDELVRCPQCNLELPRKKLAKHRRSNHAPRDRLLLNSKVCEKARTRRACSSCGAQNQETWIFELTSRGAVNLCSSCKQVHLKYSFSSEGMEKKRIMALKSALADLRKLEKEHATDAFHPNLKKEILELQELIKKPPSKPQIWSPILPGSFGSGKRR